MNKALDRMMTPLRRNGDLFIMGIALCFLLVYLSPVSWLHGADAINIKVASM